MPSPAHVQFFLDTYGNTLPSVTSSVAVYSRCKQCYNLLTMTITSQLIFYWKDSYFRPPEKEQELGLLFAGFLEYYTSAFKEEKCLSINGTINQISRIYRISIAYTLVHSVGPGRKQRAWNQRCKIHDIIELCLNIDGHSLHSMCSTTCLAVLTESKCHLSFSFAFFCTRLYQWMYSSRVVWNACGQQVMLGRLYTSPRRRDFNLATFRLQCNCLSDSWNILAANSSSINEIMLLRQKVINEIFNSYSQKAVSVQEAHCLLISARSTILQISEVKGIIWVLKVYSSFLVLSRARRLSGHLLLQNPLIGQIRPARFSMRQPLSGSLMHSDPQQSRFVRRTYQCCVQGRQESKLRQQIEMR